MKKKSRFAVMVMTLAACLMSQMTAFAASKELTAEYKDRKYTLNMEAGDLFDIKNLDYGRKYHKMMQFRNETKYDIKISMIDVINDLPEDTKVYDISNLDILINGEKIYSGDMNDARWKRTVSPGGELDIEYIYYTDDLPHVPDNSWMDREMKTTYVFVGEYDRHVEGGFSGETPGDENKESESDHSDDKESESSGESKDQDGESKSEESKDKDKDPDVIVHMPPTGDKSMAPVVLVMTVSGAGLAEIYLYDKKKNHKVDNK